MLLVLLSYVCFSECCNTDCPTVVHGSGHVSIFCFAIFLNVSCGYCSNCVCVYVWVYAVLYLNCGLYCCLYCFLFLCGFMSALYHLIIAAACHFDPPQLTVHACPPAILLLWTFGESVTAFYFAFCEIYIYFVFAHFHVDCSMQPCVQQIAANSFVLRHSLQTLHAGLTLLPSRAASRFNK